MAPSASPYNLPPAQPGFSYSVPFSWSDAPFGNSINQTTAAPDSSSLLFGSTQAPEDVKPSVGTSASKGKGRAGAGAHERDSMDGYDEDEDDAGDGDGDDRNSTEPKKQKEKSTRGSRACNVCRRLKMRCIGAEDPPCKRCRKGKHECVFEESQRGKRSNRKSDAMAQSLAKVEATLESVLKSIGHTSAEALLGSIQAQGGGEGLPSLPSLGTSSDTVSPNSMGQKPSQSPDVGGNSRLALGNHYLAPTGSAWKGESSSKASRSVGERLQSLPDNTLNPLGLLAEASLHNSRKRSKHAAENPEERRDSDNSTEDGDQQGSTKKAKLGMANKQYFQPSAATSSAVLPLRKAVLDQKMPPKLLVDKIVSPEECVELFELYFAHCHQAAPFLDPELHTPTMVGTRSHFLFTCICAISSRFYTKRTDGLYSKCLAQARAMAGEALLGKKSLEMVQGFLLLASFNQPAERFEHDKTWTFVGMAVRMATDLNLHRKMTYSLPDDATEETKINFHREKRNRERTWLFCFITDKSLAATSGKPGSISKEDMIIRESNVWHLDPTAQAGDDGLSAMVHMHLLISRFLDVIYSDSSSASGLNPHLDYHSVTRSTLSELDQWKATWMSMTNRKPNITPSYRTHYDQLRTYYHQYYRLFVLSFAVQHAMGDESSNKLELSTFCLLSMDSATALIKVAREYLKPSGVLRYAIDSTFVYMSYAATFLLKLCRPSLAHCVDESVALSLVQDVANALQDAAMDDFHTPALYASFLRALIESKRSGIRTAPGSRTATRPSTPNPHAMDIMPQLVANSCMPGTSALDAALDPFLTQVTSSLNAASQSVSVEPTSMLGTLNGTIASSNGGGSEDPSNNGFSLNLDQLDLWGPSSSLLFPGFGHGSLQGLSGGMGTIAANDSRDPWFVQTPFHSRPGSPTNNDFFTNISGLDFGVQPFSL